MATATDVASSVSCPEAWRPRHGFGLPPEVGRKLEAGVRKHEETRAAEVESMANIRIVLVMFVVGAALFVALGALSGGL